MTLISTRGGDMVWWLVALAHAGLGPDDVVVLYNADDPEALETAEQYAVARDLTDAQLCPVSGIAAETTAIDFATFDTQIRAPFEACRDALPYPDDIDAIVIVRGLPYVVQLERGVASLSATLQVGRAQRSDGTELASFAQGQNGAVGATIANPMWGAGGSYLNEMTASYGANGNYVKSPQIVHGDVRPGPFVRVEAPDAGSWGLTGNLYIVTRLDGFDHRDARALIDRAISAETQVPNAPFMCMRGADAARGVRDAECEHALRMLDAQGFETDWVAAFDNELTHGPVMSYWTGAASMRGAIDGVEYAPGAVVDNLTSFGARPNNFFCDETGETCPASESQTSIARFVRAGATGVQGTVAEPYNNCFPNAGTLLLYANGFSLGEAWIANQRYLHWVNTYLGDPLTTPFNPRPQVQLPQATPVDEALDLTVEHPDGVRRITIYVDGTKVYDDGDPDVGTSLIPTDWGLDVGDEVEVLVVAVAADAPPVDVDGWPAAEVPFYPRTKGWIRSTLRIDPPIFEQLPTEGCGCQSQPGPWILLWPILLMFRRRS